MNSKKTAHSKSSNKPKRNKNKESSPKSIELEKLPTEDELNENDIIKKWTGRPTKFEKRFCEMLIRHFFKKKSFASFAGEILVDPDTLYEWVKKHKDFSEAKKIGEAISLGRWEETGATIINNSPKDYNAAPYIYLMKCRFRKFGYMPGDGSASEGDGVEFEYDDVV